MLIAYLEPLLVPQVALLNSWQRVHYWPRSYAHTDLYSAAIPLDYWLLFSDSSLALLWIMRYPEQSRIVRTLFD